MFSKATGLVTNFSKSTVTPMHLPSGALQEIMDILQCKVGSFLQTYLGLPLFNIKLPLAAFAPLIARIDRYLASWQALLLSTAGRVVLINSVLAESLAMQWGQCCCRLGLWPPSTRTKGLSCGQGLSRHQR